MSEAIRICMITTPDLACETGSTLHGRDLAGALAKLGHDVNVLSATLPAFQPPGVRFHPLPLPLEHPVFVDRPISSQDLYTCIKLLTEKIAGLHAEKPVDLVHCHYTTFTAAAGSAIWWLYGIPMVVSTFGRDLTLGAQKDPRYLRMTKACLREAKRVIAATPKLGQEVINRFGALPQNVMVLPMGLDEEQFNPEQDTAALRQQWNKGILIVTMASAFGPEKGIDLLLSAIHQSRHAKDVQLLVLGDDDEPKRMNFRRIQKLATELDLLDRIVFCGRVPHSQIPKYLAAADLVVDPRLSGNYSSSMLEALAMGRMVIGSDVANEWGALEHGENGYVFRAGNVHELVNCLNEVLGNPEIRARLADGARRKQKPVIERFRISAVADATSRLYAVILAEGPQG